jgi:hypothetical protein
MKWLLTFVTIAIALLVTSKAFGDNESRLEWHNAEIAQADRDEAAGIAEWDTNRQHTNESLEDYFERVMDTGAIQDNSGEFWEGFLHARKRGLL